MSPRPDFAIYSPDHKLQLVVEVKGTPRSDAAWAAKLRRNLIAHGAVPRAPYFLLVLPDHLYLWSHSANNDSGPPDFRANTKEVLKRYLSHLSDSNDRAPVSERGLEFAVHSWLSDLTESDEWVAADSQANEWLTRSGLAERIRTGTVRSETTI